MYIGCEAAGNTQSSPHLLAKNSHKSPAVFCSTLSPSLSIFQLHPLFPHHHYSLVTLPSTARTIIVRFHTNDSGDRLTPGSAGTTKDSTSSNPASSSLLQSSTRNDSPQKENSNVSQFSCPLRSVADSLAKSSFSLRRTSIIIPHIEQPQVHRVVIDHATPFPHSDIGWSKTFPRSLIPVPKSPDKARSVNVSTVTSPTKTGSLYHQSPKTPLLPKLSSLFNHKDQISIDISRGKPSSPPSTMGKAPILLTQLRANERTRKLHEDIMAKNKKSRGRKGGKAPVTLVASSDSISSTHSQLTDVKAIGSSASNTNALNTANILQPPELFKKPSLPQSTMPSPSMHSTFQSPRTGSTGSQMFDDSFTGPEMLRPEEKDILNGNTILEGLAEALVVAEHLIAEVNTQIIFANRSEDGSGEKIKSLIEKKKQHGKTYSVEGVTAGTKAPRSSPADGSDKDKDDIPDETPEDPNDTTKCRGRGPERRKRDRSLGPDDQAGGAGVARTGNVARDSATPQPKQARGSAGQSNDSKGVRVRALAIDQLFRASDGAQGDMSEQLSRGEVKFELGDELPPVFIAKHVQPEPTLYEEAGFEGEVKEVATADTSRQSSGGSSTSSFHSVRAYLNLRASAIAFGFDTVFNDNDEEQSTTSKPLSTIIVTNTSGNTDSSDHDSEGRDFDSTMSSFCGDEPDNPSDESSAATHAANSSNASPDAQQSVASAGLSHQIKRSKKKSKNKRNKKNAAAEAQSAIVLDVTQGIASMHIASNSQPQISSIITQPPIPTSTSTPQLNMPLAKVQPHTPNIDGSVTTWGPGHYLTGRAPSISILVEEDTIQQLTGLKPTTASDTLKKPAVSEKAQSKLKAFTGFRAEADEFVPRVSEPYPLHDLASQSYTASHPNTKFMSRADVYKLDSYAALGAPILRDGPNEEFGAMAFLQTNVPSVDPLVGIKEGDINSGEPHDVRPGDGYERYQHAHLRKENTGIAAFKIGDINAKVHNTHFGSYYTAEPGNVLIAPPINSQLYTKKLSQFDDPLPWAALRNDRSMVGVPLEPRSTPSYVPDWNYIDFKSNPFRFANGSFVEVQPISMNLANEQFLIAMGKFGEIHAKRIELLADKKWMEPPIPTGFSKRAKHNQGIQTPDNTSEGPAISKPVDALEIPVTVLSNKKNVPATSIKSGMRGGGDTTMPSYLMNPITVIDMKDHKHKKGSCDCNRKDYSALNGVLLPPHADLCQWRPYVTLQDSTKEPIMPALTLRLIANDMEKGVNPVLIFGGYYGPSPSGNNWSTTPRFTCSCCCSPYHGLKDCPLFFLNNFQVKCAHCERDGHFLHQCPYPVQNLKSRTVVQSMILYAGTLHFKLSLLVWQYEMGEITDKKFLTIRKMLKKNPLLGESLHAFTKWPCPNCEYKDHSKRIGEFVENCAQRLRDGKGASEEQLIKGAWYIDRCHCPLYWHIYNIHYKTVEFLAYNPNNSVAVDALYRIIMRAQEWHIKTPIPIPDKHLCKNTGVKILPDFALMTKTLFGEEEMTEEWVHDSGESDFKGFWA